MPINFEQCCVAALLHLDALAAAAEGTHYRQTAAADGSKGDQKEEEEEEEGVCYIYGFSFGV